MSTHPVGDGGETRTHSALITHDGFQDRSPPILGSTPPYWSVGLDLNQQRFLCHDFTDRFLHQFGYLPKFAPQILTKYLYVFNPCPLQFGFVLKTILLRFPCSSMSFIGITYIFIFLSAQNKRSNG